MRDPAAQEHPDFTERDFRDALSEFVTGVTVICARADSARFVGFTASSFNSASLDPPLVLWSLSRRSRLIGHFETAERYSINVLADDQVELARRFSRAHRDRFAGVPYRLGWAHAPLIAGAVAWFECRHHAHVHAGDHVVFVGEVVRCGRTKGHALVFQHSRYGRAVPLPHADRDR